nr:MAG TPA: hypothetical protein [Caudoviricetes sp.]
MMVNIKINQEYNVQYNEPIDEAVKAALFKAHVEELKKTYNTPQSKEDLKNVIDEWVEANRNAIFSFTDKVTVTEGKEPYSFVITVERTPLERIIIDPKWARWVKKYNRAKDLIRQHKRKRR